MVKVENSFGRHCISHVFVRRHQKYTHIPIEIATVNFGQVSISAMENSEGYIVMVKLSPACKRTLKMHN